MYPVPNQLQNKCKNWVEDTNFTQLHVLKWQSILTKLGKTQEFKGAITLGKCKNAIHSIYRLKKTKYTIITIEQDKYLIIINIQ